MEDKDEIIQSETEIKSKKDKKFDRAFYITVVILLLLLVAETLLYTFVFFHVTIKGSSMEPTLYSEQALIVNKLTEPERGDIIIISGKSNGRLLVKRLIAVGGDTVTIKGGYVYLNGEVLQEEYLNVQGLTFYPNVSNLNNTDEMTWTINEGEYFFLGDNRRNSNDSRYYGTCTREQIEGVISDFALKIRGVTKVFNTIAITVKSWFGITGIQGE